MEDTKAFTSLLKNLSLPSNLSREQFIELVLGYAAHLLNEEKRKEALKFLRLAKTLLPYASTKNRALFYITLANSFISANDYGGAEKSLKKAKLFVDKSEDPSLRVKFLNLQFIIARTLKRPHAEQFLERSREISLKNNLYENLVFCEVNLGLIAFFKKDHSRAMEHLKRAIEVVSKHPYPKEKLIMLCDFFLQVLSENSGYVRVSKYYDLILKGADIVFSAINVLDDPHQGAKRLSLLVSFLKMSDDLLIEVLRGLESKIAKLSKNYRAIYYSGIASGLANYKNYTLALKYFDQAISNSNSLSDDEIRVLKKKHAFTLAMALRIRMLYDLTTTSNFSYRIKRIQVVTLEPTLLGRKDTRITLRNAVADSDAIFTVDENFVRKRIYSTLKNYLNVKRVLSYFGHEKSKHNLLEKLDVFVINAVDHRNALTSILFVGSNIKESPKILKGKNVFTTYQILGHIVPKSLNCAHIENYDVKFLYDLVRAPQKFKKIEILVPSEDIAKEYETIF
ncbi:MAG: hypothetical protein DRH56_10670 [Deltaproteobacteria bacterium]|nr:MAG: hypothetical protein DRH56_10670 [Deltaproteobacteria bacterium]